MATMKGVKNINESTKQILEIVRSMHTQSQNSEFSKSDILSWLNAVDPTESAEPHQKRRLPGTCEWFFNHETYSAWKDGSDEASKSVIVYGIPGAGKSVLASEIVRRLELERDRGTLTVYFFFRETEISLRTPVEMLASIISQLLKSGCDTERCYDILKQHLIDSSFFARSKEKRRTADNLMMCLLEMLRGFPKRVNLVLDALDECDEPRKIAEFVELRNNYGAFSRKARVPSIIYGNSARILLTGRPVYVVKQSFVSLEEANVLSVIQMDVGDDIKKLIEDTVKDRPELKHVKDMIVQTIHENSDGMFRYAALVLEELLEYSPDPIPIRLKNMPKELAGMYDLILQRLHYRTRGRSQAWDVDMRKRILMWVSMSYIPISIQEMALACVVTEDRLLKPEEVMLPTESMILLCCGSLIEALQSDGNTILRFTHRTVKEFLLRQLDSQPTSNDLSAQYMFTEEEAHAYIALISVKQLSSPSLFNGYKDIFGMPNTTVEDTPEKRSPFHYPLYFGLEHAEIVACYEHQSDTAMRMWTALWEWLDKGDDRFFHWMRHVSTFEGKIRKFWTFVAGSDIFKRADYYGDSGHFANAKLHSQADTHTYHLSTIGGKQERSKRVFILLFLILLDLEPLIILNIETYREYWEMELASKVDRHYLHHGQYFSYAIHHQNLSAAIYFLENGLVSSDAMNTPGFLYGCISDVLRQKSNFALPLVDMVVDSEGLDLNVRNWEGESIMARHLLRGGETLLDLMNAEADHAMSYRWCYSDYDPWEGNCACIRIAEGRGQTILEKPVEGIVFRPGGPLFFDHVTHAGPTHRALCFKVIEKIKQKGGKTRKELGEYLIDSSKYKKVWYNNGVDTVACKLSDIL
ncbi:hypothetical protein BJ508DRAFT_167141 [Ascobolus immersus RN42]|uniref:NACHT domain-containing protein n=1 Tax=Ascobolus immersus RN42 TaxID=1160509 RepID=A0A3N4INH6_ASCIM|nr:hypothetical protein BJ508DRAFT_167141 [Ascobolus immersus RN42]